MLETHVFGDTLHTMEAVHEKSHLDTHLPELTGLWVVPPTQADIIRTHNELVDAKGDLNQANELRFETGAKRDFIELSLTPMWRSSFRLFAQQEALSLVTTLPSPASLHMASFRRSH